MIGADRQIRRPGDGAAFGLAIDNNLMASNDFPAHRKRGSLPQPAPGGLARSDHHGPLQQPARHFGRQRIEDDLQGGVVRHMAVTLPIDKFGLDP